jgi:hypothetical protein
MSLTVPNCPMAACAVRAAADVKSLTFDPTLVTDLQRLVEPVTMGDPERPLNPEGCRGAWHSLFLQALGRRHHPVRKKRNSPS